LFSSDNNDGQCRSPGVLDLGVGAGGGGTGAGGGRGRGVIEHNVSDAQRSTTYIHCGCSYRRGSWRPTGLIVYPVLLSVSHPSIRPSVECMSPTTLVLGGGGAGGPRQGDVRQLHQAHAQRHQVQAPQPRHLVSPRSQVLPFSSYSDSRQRQAAADCFCTPRSLSRLARASIVSWQNLQTEDREWRLC
jgi:hypothetical protein